jgi:hypothetical protein
MKVLVAVLSSRQPPWGEMIATSHTTWDAVDVPGVETIYYVGEPESALENKVVGFPVPEGYNTMGRKNLLAWKWMLDNYEFDFMARVNASCYVHKARLHAHCQDLLPFKYLAGSIYQGDEKRATWMWGGHQFLMSRDVVEALVMHPETWNHAEMDDVALSHAATALGVPFTHGNHACAIDKLENEKWRVVSTDGTNFEFTEWSAVAELTNQFFFRCKIDLKRHIDATVMRKLQKHLLP